MLTALIEVGHDDRNALGLLALGGDDALEVLEVVVRRHGHFHAVHAVGIGVIRHVAEDVQVVSTDALPQHGLALARGETRAIGIQQEAFALIAG